MKNDFKAGDTMIEFEAFSEHTCVWRKVTSSCKRNKNAF